MTEELWGKKPDAELEDLFLSISAYEATEMDTWLEKVKDKLEWQEQHNKQMWMNLCIANKKLEAIMSWFNDWINPWLDKAGEEGFMLPKKRMISLKKILEADA